MYLWQHLTNRCRQRSHGSKNEMMMWMRQRFRWTSGRRLSSTTQRQMRSRRVTWWLPPCPQTALRMRPRNRVQELQSLSLVDPPATGSAVTQRYINTEEIEIVDTRDERNFFFNPTPFRFQWFIPIPFPVPLVIVIPFLYKSHSCRPAYLKELSIPSSWGQSCRPFLQCPTVGPAVLQTRRLADDANAQ